MKPINADTRAAWTVADLNADTAWICELDDRARRDMLAAAPFVAEGHQTSAEAAHARAAASLRHR